MVKLISLILTFFSLQTLANDKIYHGSETNEQVFSSVVSIRVNKEHLCTGTLIRRNVVLTAAHCLRGYFQTPRELKVLYKKQLQSVNSHYIHPGFLFSKNFDIALLILNEEINDPNLTLAKILPEKQNLKVLKNFNEFIVVGYGLTESGQSGLKKKVTLKRKEIKTTKFSLIGKDQKDSCNGDSGGPVFKLLNGTPYIIGVVKSSRRLAVRKCGDGGLYTFASFGNSLLNYFDGNIKNPYDLNNLEDRDLEKALIMLHELEFKYFDKKTLELMKKDFNKFRGKLESEKLKALIDFKLNLKISPNKKVNLEDIREFITEEYLYPMLYDYSLSIGDKASVDFLFNHEQKVKSRLTESYKARFLYYEKEDYQSFLNQVDELRDFEDALLKNLKANALFNLGRNKEAKVIINEAIDLNKLEISYYITKRKILKSLRLSTRKIKKEIKNLEKRNSLYKAVNSANSDPAQAIRLINSIRELKGYDYEKFFALGRAYRSLEEYKSATIFYLNAFRISGNTDALKEVYTIFRYDIGDKRSALRYLSQLLDIAPSANYYHERAKFYRELKQMDKANADLERARKLAPYETWSL